MVRLDRFSPFHTHADRFGFKRMRPARAYYYVFPFGREEIDRIAYYFDFDYDDGRQPQSYVFPVQEEARKWTVARGKDGLAKPRLDAHFAEGRATVEDTRLAAVAPRHELGGLAAGILLRCDSAAQPEVLAAEFATPLAMVHDILADLMERRLVVESGGKYLTLAVFRNRPQPSPSAHSTETMTLVSQTAHS